MVLIVSMHCIINPILLTLTVVFCTGCNVKAKVNVFLERYATSCCSAVPSDGVPFTMDGYRLLMGPRGQQQGAQVSRRMAASCVAETL